MVRGEIFPFEDLEPLGYSSYRNRTGYTISGGVAASSTDDGAVAVIREYLRGNVGDIRLSMSEANSSVSEMQGVISGLEAINDKLSRAGQLCEQAIYGYYTSGEKAQMQEKVEELIKEINDTVGGTSYAGNKILTSEGHTLAIAKDAGEKIYVFPGELGFDAEVDLTVDAKAALAEFQEYGNKVEDFSRFVSRQYDKLLGYMDRLEEQWGQVLGIKSSGFETSSAEAAGENIIKAVSENGGSALYAQANVSGQRVLSLLEYEV